jgi:2-oxoglutarate dehydrogenase E1 component
VSELDYRQYGFTEADLDRTFDAQGVAGFAGFLGAEAGGRSVTLRTLLARLQVTYCGTVGWEFMHISDREKANWIRERCELVAPPEQGKAKRLQIYDRLAHSVMFEQYLANKFNTAKRFGLEGCESLVPGLKAMVDTASLAGVESVVFGMPHRGRLNVLVNVIRKPMENLLREFLGTHVDLERYTQRLSSGDWSGSGDVKYHLGTSYDRVYPDGRRIHLALVANPSHLEAVNPVVAGKVRAKQDLIGDAARTKVMGILLHGDAAFAGQGVVYETLAMAQLTHYRTGGTVHVICNNQVGFTTDPESGRSTLHPSDLGKAFDLPTFHVNADDPEAVTRVFEVATQYRTRFQTDVIVDLVGYRKYGHNELDQPMFTQPVMYAKIAQHPTALDIYGGRLTSGGVATVEELAALRAGVDKSFSESWGRAQAKAPTDAAGPAVGAVEWLTSKWKGFNSPDALSRIRPTGVPLATLGAIGERLCTVPPTIKLHANIARIMKEKERTLKAGEGLDWATAEALAFGSLLLEGNSVRLSGQDVERGTFSHRHAVLHDQTSAAVHVPLAALAPSQASFLATNSPLSEFGVMGFELGYSLEHPNQLVLWEAQFGDFVNGAQIIIDQFLTSGETKWLRQSGLTLLLPHGMEGQGPEHSSARIERFLQAVDDQEDVVPDMAEDTRMQIQHTNIQVVNCTTPANYFHVLRRQVHRAFRKPLVVASPKSLLRHKSAVSSLKDMGEGTAFQRVIGDAGGATASPTKVRKLLLCTGKVYYDLEKQRADLGAKDVAIVRIEQIAPFPFDLVAKEVARYPNAKVAFVQEEPRNMGAWTYVAPRIATATRVLNKKVVQPVRWALYPPPPLPPHAYLAKRPLGPRNKKAGVRRAEGGCVARSGLA